MISVESVVTPGQIARKLGEPQHRIDYCLNSRRHIRPLRRAGIVRLYSPEAVEQVQRELERIDEKRGTRGSS